MSYAEVELQIVQWAEARGIIPNAKPMTQAIKTLEEVTEYMDALNKNDRAEVIDAIGDIAVTLIVNCAILDIDFVSCMYSAYDVIKDRKGYLTPEGMFVKEAN
jgi:NTP pyrophosphatase (non-canonical NTP hydrolase)